MAERDGYIPGVPCWVDTTQPDPDAAAAFYSGLFGWECEDMLGGGEGRKYLIGRIRGGDVAAISSPQDGAPEGMAMWNTYIAVESADETAAKAAEAGGGVMMEPFDVMESGRMAVIADPQGAVFCIWQANEHKGAKVVNEHGALNFNDLNTTDVEGAKAFYGVVFGWETLEMPGGMRMWTLPAYGDYLEELNPGMRAGMKEMGAAEGFENVVAAVNEIGAEQEGVPLHWGVTFGTDDADATAAKATELGGKVVFGPFDAPWVRAVVISDPAGATFTAAKFVPENKELGG